MSRQISLSDLLGPGRVAWPPNGYSDLVRRDPSLTIEHVRPSVVPTRLLYQIPRINEEVNSTYGYVRDLPGYDVWGWWRTRWQNKVGDCDDFAVEKLRRLIQAGLPRGALLLTVCRAENGVGHCILMAMTSSTKLVMDNRFLDVRDIKLHPVKSYTWISQEWPGRKFWWRKLS